MPVDDLGAQVDLPAPPLRIVSLVPSLSETVAEALPGRLVGATDWCTHPQGLPVARVRGTKNPDVGRIVDLRPDLVLANEEENRRIDVERLRAAGIPVWVTRIESVDEAWLSLRRMFTEALGSPSPDWVEAAEEDWARPPAVAMTTVIPIWRDPWMVVGWPTFTGDLVARLGLANLVADRGRYPQMSLSELIDSQPDLVLLPDEPYEFGTRDAADLAGLPHVQVPGRLITWYGPSLRGARGHLEHLIGAVVGT